MPAIIETAFPPTSEEALDAALEGSFPASDPPSALLREGEEIQPAPGPV